MVLQQKFHTLTNSFVEMLCLTNFEDHVNLARDCHVMHYQSDLIDQ